MDGRRWSTQHNYICGWTMNAGMLTLPNAGDISAIPLYCQSKMNRYTYRYTWCDVNEKPAGDNGYGIMALNIQLGRVEKMQLVCFNDSLF